MGSGEVIMRSEEVRPASSPLRGNRAMLPSLTDAHLPTEAVALSELMCAFTMTRERIAQHGTLMASLGRICIKKSIR